VHRQRNTVVKLVLMNYVSFKNYGSMITASESLLALKVCVKILRSVNYWFCNVEWIFFMKLSSMNCAALKNNVEKLWLVNYCLSRRSVSEKIGRKHHGKNNIVARCVCCTGKLKKYGLYCIRKLLQKVNTNFFLPLRKCYLG
jgi:hypothetical protein